MYCRRLVEEEGMFLCVWQDERLSGGKLKTAWAHEEQLDVRYKGAYIEEPYFWSLTEDDINQ
jgi:predicted NUDIX family NTP pyrophosphohydrolase